jgi:hypothetical protein
VTPLVETVPGMKPIRALVGFMIDQIALKLHHPQHGTQAVVLMRQVTQQPRFQDLLPQIYVVHVAGHIKMLLSSNTIKQRH